MDSMAMLVSGSVYPSTPPLIHSGINSHSWLENGGPGLSRCMYFLLKNGDIPACYASLPGKSFLGPNKRFWKKKQPPKSHQLFQQITKKRTPHERHLHRNSPCAWPSLRLPCPLPNSPVVATRSSAAATPASKMRQGPWNEANPIP